MTWTAERKIDAAIQAPLSRSLLRADSQVIERPGWYQVITPSAPGATMNEISLSQVATSEAERVIDEAIATYHALDKPVKWYVGPWTRPLDFGATLAARGFECSHLSGMGIATSAKLSPTPGVRARTVDTDADLACYVKTCTRGWNVPDAQWEVELRTFATALARPLRTLHLFVAEDEASNECIGTAAINQGADFGYFVGTQVAEAWRGRGAYRALVAARLAFLGARGIEYAVTHALEATSAPILEHFGFERLFRSTCWVLPPRERAASHADSSRANERRRP